MSGVKCINKFGKRALALAISMTVLLTFSGCGTLKYSQPYSASGENSSYDVLFYQSADKAASFASDLCVIDATSVGKVDLQVPDNTTAAVLFDLGKEEVIYAKNAHQTLYPASITKLMTALVAVKNAPLDTVLTATENVYVTESGAQVMNLKAGDRMTLDQALRILLLYSANDVSNLIAENLGGSIENFVEMMNAEAHRIGATRTHFANPNGLTDPDHYTTAYDLYLIFREALKYDTILEIISQAAYETVYYDKDGKEKTISVKNTNGYVNGSYSAPGSVTVIGGKTGTTQAAGHCLILYSKDRNSNSYISVILQSETNDDLVANMNLMLEHAGLGE